MKPELCRDAPYLHHEGVLIEMEKAGVRSLTDTVCKEIRKLHQALREGFDAASLAGMLTVIIGWAGASMPSLGGFFPCIPSAIAFVVFSLLFPDR